MGQWHWWFFRREVLEKLIAIQIVQDRQIAELNEIKALLMPPPPNITLGGMVGKPVKQ